MNNNCCSYSEVSKPLENTLTHNFYAQMERRGIRNIYCFKLQKTIININIEPFFF